jgi:ribosome biogenesis GTPase
MLVDTPGIRSLELLDGADGIGATYADIEALAESCRFPDCSHGPEPGCAVRAALASGELDQARFAGFDKLRREAAHALRERDPFARDAERRRWKAIHKSVGVHMKAKYGAR